LQNVGAASATFHRFDLIPRKSFAQHLLKFDLLDVSLQSRLLIQVFFQCFARLTQRFLRRRNIAQSVQQAEIMGLTKLN
jgi:hypothetical protein